MIDAKNPLETHHVWAARLIEDAMIYEGAGINAVILSELCAGSPEPQNVEPEIRKLGLKIFDLPAAISEVCGVAYRRYIFARRTSGGGMAPKIPPPDFFIGAHAEIMRWKLATRDSERIARYFPKVELVTPKKSKR